MKKIEDHRIRVAAERREKMKSRLNESAIHLIAAEGLNSLSIDRLIQLAGVSRGTFYKYHTDTESVIRDLALVISNELIEHAEQFVLRFDDPAMRISVGVRSLMHVCKSNPVLGQFLIHLGWQDIDQQHLMFSYVKRDLQQAQLEGRIKSIPIDLALSLVGMTTMAGLQVLMKSKGARSNVPKETAAALLRSLGMNDSDADNIANMPLPKIIPPQKGLISKLTS